VIRDRHYTPKVMLKMWNMIKQRQYEVETTRPGSADHSKGGSESKKRDLDASGEEQAGKDGDDGHEHGAGEDPEAGLETKTMEMPKKEFIDMIRSLFKVMIHGVSHDRLMVLV
jgi:hypothetical protein